MAETATKNLDIVTRVKGTEQAKAALDGMAQSGKNLSNTFVGSKGLVPSVQSSNMHLQSMSRIVQDMPYGFMAVGNNITFMAEQMAMAKAQGASMTGILKGMGAAFMGPGGIIFLISAATSLLTAWKMGALGAKEETAEFTKELERTKKILDELIKIENPFEKIVFGFKAEQLPAALDKLNSKIEKYKREIETIATPPQVGKGISFMTWVVELFESGEITAEEQKRLNNLNAIKEKLEEQATILKEQIELAEILKDIGGEEQKKGIASKDKTRSIDYYLRKLDEANEKTETLRMKNELFLGGLGFGDKMKPVTGVEKPKLIFTEEELSNNTQMMAEMFRNTSNILRDEFGSAWEDVFGEANSLFEKLIASWAQTMADKLIKKGLGGLLDLIPGGGFVSELLEL